MINKIFQYIKKENLISENAKIIIGLSGGPDSVFLLYILKELKKTINFELIAAHLNHEWRESAKIDEDFCKKITKELGVPLIIKKASELNAEIKFKGSKEEYARNLRRFFFQEILKENDATLVALAHHLNDQEETFFIRLIRGTTLKGLTCMKPLEGNYIRPLLEIKKNEILNYLKENKIDYIEDPTNLSIDFLRNRIRLNVIPELQNADKRFDDNFLRTLKKLQETENFLNKIVEEKFSEISIFNDNQLKINLEKLFNFENFLVHELIFLWLYKSNVKFELTENFLKEIIRFLKKQSSGSHQINPNWYIEKKKNIAQIYK